MPREPRHVSWPAPNAGLDRDVQEGALQDGLSEISPLNPFKEIFKGLDAGPGMLETHGHRMVC